jgi:hypothetical protein
MRPLADPALAAVADGRVRLLPERFERTYNQWLSNIQASEGGLVSCVCAHQALAVWARIARTR